MMCVLILSMIDGAYGSKLTLIDRLWKAFSMQFYLQELPFIFRDLATLVLLSAN